MRMKLNLPWRLLLVALPDEKVAATRL